MKRIKIRTPSVALVVATIALFVALGGTAGAVVTAAVPLAKRALVSDNARKLGGQTSQQLVSQASQLPGPASSAAGLVSIKTGTWSLAPDDDADFTIMCNAGLKAVGGGWDDPGGWSTSWDDRPTADGAGWKIWIGSDPDAPGTQTGGLYAVCIK